MRRVFVGIAAAAAALAGSSAAHDFWVQPATFWIAPNSLVMTSFLVGHGAARQRWDVDASRVTLFRSVGPGAAADHRSELGSGPLDSDHLVRLRDAGTHVLTLQSGYAASELPALRFNDYLKEEGLTPAADFRVRSGATERPGREIYSRRAKALIQVGPASARPQPWVTRPVGMDLEIVPLLNPYAPDAGPDLPLQVLYRGQPLAGATVKLNNLDFDARPLATLRTDATGRVTVRVPHTGSWQLNVIWTRPLTHNPRADFETTFSSLTFGFPRGPSRAG